MGEITSIDPQVSRRFTKIMPNDLVIGGSNDDLDTLIRDYCRRAGLSFTPNGNVVSRLIHGSRGRLPRSKTPDVHTVDLLMRAARPDGTPFLRRVQPMSGKERDRWHVYEDNFTEFQAAHVGLMKIAEESQVSPSVMAAALAARGIHPINVSTSSSYRFYRRSEL